MILPEASDVAWKRSPPGPSIDLAGNARPETFASPGHRASAPSTGSTAALCRANREPRTAQIRALARVHHGSEHQLAVLQHRLRRGDPR
jgi:hypothetical protein